MAGAGSSGAGIRPGTAGWRGELTFMSGIWGPIEAQFPGNRLCYFSDKEYTKAAKCI